MPYDYAKLLFSSFIKKSEYLRERDKTGFYLLEVTGEKRQKDTHGNARNRIQVVQYTKPFSNVSVYYFHENWEVGGNSNSVMKAKLAFFASYWEFAYLPRTQCFQGHLAPTSRTCMKV